MVGIGYSVSFTLATPPASKKNKRIWKRRGRRTFLLPSVKAQRSEFDIATAARTATHGRMPFAPTDTLRIDYAHDIHTDQVRVTVTKVGELPARGKLGTKRDSHGMVETIADALQGVLYTNDSQVDCGSWERVRPTALP